MGTERLNVAVWISQANPCAPSSVNSPPAPLRTGSQLSYDIQLAFEHVEEGSATLLHEVEVECRDNEPYALFCGRRTSRQLAMDQPHVVLPLAQRHPTSQWPGRCIAPDLIGMGDSDKLPDSGPNSYTFVEHRRFLDALFDALGVRENVAFVVHDRGSALGFDWAYR